MNELFDLTDITKIIKHNFYFKIKYSNFSLKHLLHVSTDRLYIAQDIDQLCRTYGIQLRMTSQSFQINTNLVFLRSGAYVCSNCSASSCVAGQYLSGCGGASAGACAPCPSESFSIKPGKLELRCGRLMEYKICETSYLHKG